MLSILLSLQYSPKSYPEANLPNQSWSAFTPKVGDSVGLQHYAGCIGYFADAVIKHQSKAT